MKKVLTVIGLITLIICNIAYAQKPAVILDDKAGWHKIGETTATFKAEKDEIVVLGADNFKAIKIKVTDAPVHINDIEVYYQGSDEKEDFQVRSDMKAGSDSRVMDLKTKGRDLKKVVFFYNSIPNASKEKAHVELWGMK